MKNKILICFVFASLGFTIQGCGPETKISGMVLGEQAGTYVSGAAVLGMVWIEDGGAVKPAPAVDGLASEERMLAYEKDMTERGLPAAYARTFTDEQGRFTLDKLYFSGETKKMVKAMKQPKVSRVTMIAFQRGYLKRALTAFPKAGEELPYATILLLKPSNWKELSDDSSFSSLKRAEFYNGYSKEFGATKEEKSWFLEYTHSNLWKAYAESDIKGNKEWEEVCGHDYSDIIISTAGMQRNPAHEKCGELLKRMGAVRENQRVWEGHALKTGEWIQTAKRLVTQAIASLGSDASEPREYSREILEGMEAGDIPPTDITDWQQISRMRLEEAKTLYGKGNKVAAYKALGQALCARIRVVPTNVTETMLIPAIKDATAGFYQLMNRPLTAQLPGGDDTHNDGKQVNSIPPAQVNNVPSHPINTAPAPRSFKDIDRELKQTRSTATAMALIESIGKTTPQTDEDVAILGQLMDRFPVEGQKAASKIKDPKLATSVIKELDRQHVKLRAARARGKSPITDKDRQDWLNGYMNSQALIQTLGNMKARDSIPILRTYLDDADLSQPASIALGHLGDDASLNAMLGSIEKNRNIDLSGYGDNSFVRIIEEIDKPGINNERKMALINQIKGSRSPARKKVLKELALKHKDEDVRNRSAQALVSAMLINPEDGDSDFLYEWVPKAIDDINAGWSLTALRIHFPDKNKPLEKRFVPVLIEVLHKGKYESDRSEAAKLLGLCRVTESLPYLEECAQNDLDSYVRGACRHAYWEITGKVSLKFNPTDVVEQEGRFQEQRTILYYSRLRENDPGKVYFNEIKKAIWEYRKMQKRDKK